MADGGFELGTPNPVWTETSLNFGTPVCSVSLCGNGTGTGPRTGTYWAWFGGVSGSMEEASVEQTISIPSAGSVYVHFYLESALCNGSGFLELVLTTSSIPAGQTVWSINQDSQWCGVLGYRPITVDISAFAGSLIDLKFHGVTQGDGTVNFFIDDASLLIDDVIFISGF